MSEMPTFEKKENLEARVIRLLKEKGPEDPEARKILLEWTKEQEQQVEKSKDPEAPIHFNLRRARLYLAAGYIDEAWENFEDARKQAWNEQRLKLYDAIEKEMDKVEEENLNK